jgi:Asp-tRNA(Asn)/Glu-tRNA(Gln) amidotransferase C subunit
MQKCVNGYLYSFDFFVKKGLIAFWRENGLYFLMICVHMLIIIFILLLRMLTREQLDHLCMLTALEFTDAEKEQLLPQLSGILDLVGELNNVVVEDEDDATANSSYTGNILPAQENRREDFLSNIRHHIVNHMPELKTGLGRG